MSARLRATILGCGSSAGVPRIGGDWGDCDPANPKNRRSRCSLLVERITGDGVTRVLIDTTPDLRSQLLAAGIGLLDGVVYTHSHADHIHGIDDLRTVVQNRRARLPVWADAETAELLLSRFAYVFVQPAGSLYPPILDLATIDGPFVVDGAGGADPVPAVPRPARAHRGARLPHPRLRLPAGRLRDPRRRPGPTLAGLDTWVLDALRRKPHPTHAHLDTQASTGSPAPRRAAAVLTNMHNDLDYATLAAELPPNVVPAYDGLDARDRRVIARDPARRPAGLPGHRRRLRRHPQRRLLLERRRRADGLHPELRDPLPAVPRAGRPRPRRGLRPAAAALVLRRRRRRLRPRRPRRAAPVPPPSRRGGGDRLRRAVLQLGAARPADHGARLRRRGAGAELRHHLGPRAVLLPGRHHRDGVRPRRRPRLRRHRARRRPRACSATR